MAKNKLLIIGKFHDPVKGGIENITSFQEKIYRNFEDIHFIFFSKKKIISINHQAFALPPNKKILLTVKENNNFFNVNSPKDDAIKNFMNDILKSIKNKKYKNYYNNIFYDAYIRDQLRKQ